MMRSIHREASTPSSRPDASVERPSYGGWSDARVCRQVVARHARTFSVASWLLPAPKRRAAYAVYATCRIADDIVDMNTDAPQSASGALRRFRDQAFQALNQTSGHPVLRELARAWRAFRPPDQALAELFDTLEVDVVHRGYESWPDLERYCQGVAGSVGAICCSIFGTVDVDGSRGVHPAVNHARTLGVAMQLTNILRDVGEDARRGRCYLPATELDEFGLTPDRVVAGIAGGLGSPWEDFLRFQIARARDLYRQAIPGIRLLQPDARSCAAACADGYARILNAIEAAAGNTLSRKVSASRLMLLGVIWRSWRSRSMLAGLEAGDAGVP